MFRWTFIPAAPAASQPDWLRLLLYVLVLGVLLHVGQALFVPLAFALLLSFMLYPICQWLEKRRIPRPLAIALALLLLMLLTGALFFLLIRQFAQFSQEWPAMRVKMISLIEQVSQYLTRHFHLPLTIQALWLERMLMSGAQQVLPVARQVAYQSAVGLVLLILIPFYCVMILYYREQFVAVLLRLFPQTQGTNVRQVLRQTITTFYDFIKGMALVYLIVGILNALGLLVLGIPHAVLLGLIASVLTFIPYIGITLGSLLPMALAWLTYDSVWYPLGVVAIFTFVQYLEANIIFPIAVSYRLQVNTLFMVLAIIAGSLIWGAAGMILFVPFLAILKLIAEKVPGWQMLAFLLSIGTKSNTRQPGLPANSREPGAENDLQEPGQPGLTNSTNR
jgi:predicted PurR-regulated permease PerM